MKTAFTLIACAAAAALQAMPPAAAAELPSAPLQSLRSTTVDKTTEPDAFGMERDQPPIARDFVQQPPLIPHDTRGYRIAKDSNNCLDCHAGSVTGAPKVSGTHFDVSTGREPANISPRRYFCTICHVPQTDAKPLVANTYKRQAEIAPAR
jgi:cytochrome c-type protein NapB